MVKFFLYSTLLTLCLSCNLEDNKKVREINKYIKDINLFNKNYYKIPFLKTPMLRYIFLALKINENDKNIINYVILKFLKYREPSDDTLNYKLREIFEKDLKDILVIIIRELKVILLNEAEKIRIAYAMIKTIALESSLNEMLKVFPKDWTLYNFRLNEDSYYVREITCLIKKYNLEIEDYLDFEIDSYLYIM